MPSFITSYRPASPTNPTDVSKSLPSVSYFHNYHPLFSTSSLKSSSSKTVTTENEHNNKYDSHFSSLQRRVLKDLAVDALIPVFYPHPNLTPNYYNRSSTVILTNESSTNTSIAATTTTTTTTSSSSKSSNLMNIESTRTIDAEKALKKLLGHFQKIIMSSTTITSTVSSSSSCISHTNNPADVFANTNTAKERQACRKFLKDIVLGTSIMRIRLFYMILAVQDLLLQQQQQQDKVLYGGNSTFHDIPCSLLLQTIEPIIGVSMNKVEAIYDNTPPTRYSLLFDHHQEEHRRMVVKVMVDLYCNNILETRPCHAKKDITDILMKYVSKTTSSTSTSEKISILYSLPKFFVELLVRQYGETKAEEMANVFNQPGPIHIRRNSIHCSSDELLCQRLLKDHDISTCIPSFQQKATVGERGCTNALQLLTNDSWDPSKVSIYSIDAWKDGWFEVQDAGSQLIVRSTEVQAGGDDDNDELVIVDYCAGNGGKTFALASLLHEVLGCDNLMKAESSRKGTIIAHDIVSDRLKQLKGSLSRIGLHNGNNGSQSDGSFTNSTTVYETSNLRILTTLDAEVHLKIGMADVVLVDAPCSSTGVLRRRPSQRFRLNENEIINEFPHLQTLILNQAAQLVNAGGKLIYATCSISHYENEDVVKAFETSADDFFTKWERWDFDEDIDEEGIKSKTAETRHCRTLLPNIHGSDGFFIARWRRQ